MDEILESELNETEPCFPEPDFFDSILVGCTDEAGVSVGPATSAPEPPMFPGSILEGISSGDGSDASEVEEMMRAAEGMLGGTNVAAQDFAGQSVEKKDAGDDVQPSTKNATVNGNVVPPPESSAGPDIFEKSEDEDNTEVLSEKGDKLGDEVVEKMEVDEDKDAVEEDEDKDEGEEDEDKKTDEETHNAIDSPALSRASTVVTMSVPKISISPKRKILNSPARNTRGRLNDSVGREKPPKRRLSESEGESGSVYSSESNDEEEEPGSTTRSGKPVRKSPRTSNNDVSNNLRSRPERKRKRTARYVEDEEDITSSGGSKHKRESKYHQDRKRNDDDDDDDSDLEMFTPIKAKMKPSRSPNYKINADGSITFDDKDGSIIEIPESRVKLVRLSTDLLRKYGKACDETENSSSSDDESRSQHDPNNPFLLEVCVDNITSVEEAVKGGAKRIELCSSLSEGGLTPAPGFLTYVKEKYEVPVFVMIRPRGGDFVYSEAEIDIMERDITYLSQLGADGFVFGALTKDSKVDVESCRRLLKSANQLPCTFHRAFDKVADPLVALEKIISLNFARILTSGQAATAQQGLGQLSRLVKAAKKRIIILPGAGINVGNVSTIVKRTGVHEVHGSASKTVQTTMAVAGPSHSAKRGGRKSRNSEEVKMGTTDDTIIKVTDRTKVAQMVRRGQESVKY